MTFRHQGHIVTITDDELVISRYINGKLLTIKSTLKEDLTYRDFMTKLNSIILIEDSLFLIFVKE